MKEEAKTSACEMFHGDGDRKCEKAHWPNKAISPQTQRRQRERPGVAAFEARTAQGCCSRLQSAVGGKLPVPPRSKVVRQPQELGEEWRVLPDVKCERQMERRTVLACDPIEVMKAQVGESP